MTGTDDPTRRDVLRTGGALGAAALGTGAVGTVAGKPDKGKQFGRVYANGVLWRTNVVYVLDGRPDPEDKLYFRHDGERPIVANAAASGAQRSPFVSESAPGDRDRNGGQWTHFAAEVTAVAAFDDAPLTTSEAVLSADYVDVSPGRTGFGPPNVYPLNELSRTGRASGVVHR